jgi:hypothetical protein
MVNRPGRLLLVIPIFAAAGWFLAVTGYLSGSGGGREVNEGGWMNPFVLYLGAYAAAEGAWNVYDKAQRRRTPPEERVAPPWCLWVRRSGVVLAATSALVLVGAFGCAAKEARTPSLGAEDKFGEIAPGTLPLLPSAMPDRGLAYAFLPVLEFVDDEDWLPSRADDYAGRLELQDLSGNPAELPEGGLPVQCDDVTQDACYVLACPATAPGCTQAPSSKDAPGTVYAHVMRFGRKRDARFFVGRASRPLPDSNDEPRLVNVIIQYWLFYAHDRWRAVTPVGYLVQEHAADWESVTVGLAGREPLFVAYSGHCGGRWYRWRDVEVKAGFFDGERWRRTARRRAEVRGLHPLVAVALGSHANYLHSWFGRPPDWGSCRRVPEDATWALTFAGNVRDLTASDKEVFPRDVHLVDSKTPVMSFRGFWGPTDRISLQAFGDPNDLARHPGRGPVSPALKGIWNRPLQTIFASNTWKEGQL